MPSPLLDAPWFHYCCYLLSLAIAIAAGWLLFVHCCCDCCLFSNKFAVAVVAIFPVMLPLLGCHHLSMCRSVAGTTAVATIDAGLPVDCCCFLAVTSSHCKCGSHCLLFLLWSLLLAAPWCFKSSCCSFHLVFLLQSFAGRYFFLVLAWLLQSHHHAYVAISAFLLLHILLAVPLLQWHVFLLWPQSPPVDCFSFCVCHCGCHAVVAVAVAVQRQMQWSPCAA